MRSTWLEAVLDTGLSDDLDRDIVAAMLFEHLPKAELRTAILEAIAGVLARRNIKDHANDLALDIAMRATEAVETILGVK